MSVFSIGGNAGFATDPLFVAAVLTATGARGIAPEVSARNREPAKPPR